jgi:hypothetical protein
METIYAGDTNYVTITCPKCGSAKNRNVTEFKNTPKRLKAKCKCGEVFRIFLEFRGYYRKIVRLSGDYFVQEKDEKGEVLIKNISINGINFETLKPHNISKDDLVELNFALDNPNKTELQTLIKILWVSDINVAGQFIDETSLNQDLVLYLRK